MRREIQAAVLARPTSLAAAQYNTPELQGDESTGGTFGDVFCEEKEAELDHEQHT